jgi:hypothetical protein
MIPLALASLAAATALPSATLVASSLACDELASHLRDVLRNWIAMFEPMRASIERDRVKTSFED